MYNDSEAAGGISMHELGIARSLAEAASDAAREAGLARVRVVRAAVGELSGVDAAALAAAWEFARDLPGFESAELECDVVPVAIECPSCRRTVQPESSWNLKCPVCQSPSRDVRAGRELLLVQLEGE